LDYSDIDAMLEEIKEMKDQSPFVKGGEGKVKTIRRALKQTIELGKNTATRRNQLKKTSLKGREEETRKYLSSFHLLNLPKEPSQTSTDCLKGRRNRLRMWKRTRR
jgi:hypothetical protein